MEFIIKNEDHLLKIKILEIPESKNSGYTELQVNVFIDEPVA